MTEIEIIANMLRKAIGLNPNSIGHDVIRRAVHSRMLLIKKTPIAEYLAWLQSDAAEIKSLIEAVVIPETSFFRDREPFNALTEYARQWLVNQPGKVVKILSIPSSTGEEPYSIAMALLEAGMKRTEFKILAHDVSEPLLAMARQGIYTDYSFRGCDDHYKVKYFTKDNNSYHISEAVKSCVEFRQANILNDVLTVPEGPYDVVFCRNLLIYFDKDVKEIVIRKLSDVLAEGGMLFVGHAETASLPAAEFSRFSASRAFAYIKTAGGGRSAPVTMAPRDSIVKRGMEIIRLQQEQRRGLAAQGNVTDSKASVAWHGQGQYGGGLRERQAVAEQLEACFQRKDDAELGRLCAWVIANAPENSSHAFYYLGLLSMNNADSNGASEHFKKSIYLDPDYYPALLQLHAIEQGKGNGALAHKYRQRAERVMRRKNVDKQ